MNSIIEEFKNKLREKYIRENEEMIEWTKKLNEEGKEILNRRKL